MTKTPTTMQWSILKPTKGHFGHFVPKQQKRPKIESLFMQRWITRDCFNPCEHTQKNLQAGRPAILALLLGDETRVRQGDVRRKIFRDCPPHSEISLTNYQVFWVKFLGQILANGHFLCTFFCCTCKYK